MDRTGLLISGELAYLGVKHFQFLGVSYARGEWCRSERAERDRGILRWREASQ